MTLAEVKPMDADQIHDIICNELPTELHETVRRLDIKFAAETRILTHITAIHSQADKRFTISDMIAPEYSEQRVVQIINHLVQAIGRAVGANHEAPQE